MTRKRKIKQDLNMTEHAARLRGIAPNPWDYIRRWFTLLVAGTLLIALGWLALGR